MKMYFKTTEQVDFSHINEFLNISKEVDIDCSGDLEITYELAPDETKYGLNGIDVSIISIVGTIEWSTADEYLTPEERLAVEAAGGTLMNNDYYEGSFDLNVTDSNEEWKIKVENTQFTNTGGFYFDGIEIDAKRKTITL